MAQSTPSLNTTNGHTGRRGVATLTRQVQSFLFVSGFSALLLEVVYVKLLRYWVGNTAHAVAAVLCAYMLGLALGSFLAGKWLIGASRLLAIYGGMELLVGLYSAALPFLMRLLEPAYLSMTAHVGPDSRLALAVHFTAAIAVLLVPTLLMGATYPVMVRAASQASADSPDAAEKLYYSNLAGAAAGTLLSDFLFIRFWGLGNTLLLVAGVNSVLAACALLLQRRIIRSTPAEEASAATDSEVATYEPAGPDGVVPRRSAQRARLPILLTAFLGGFLVLFLEMVWTSMVGRFLDNTVYAFAVTLFAIIAGLGAGAAIVNRLSVTRATGELLAHSCLGAGLLVMVLIPFWGWSRILANQHPIWCVGLAVVLLWSSVFAISSSRRASAWYFAVTLGIILAILCRSRLDPPGAQFWVLHGVDFSVSVIFMVAPAVLMGMIFPLVLRWHLAPSGTAPRSVAPVYAMNTVGCLAGVLAATFVVLPWLGVEKSGGLAGLGFFAAGLALLWPKRIPRRRWSLALALIMWMAWVHYSPGWNFTRTLRFLKHRGEVAYQREDLNNGITTVLHDGEDWYILVNGLFNGGTNLEERDQARIALIPLLYVHNFERALVVGIGTGQSAGIMGEYPFRHIDVVDFSPRVVEAADRYFSFMNFGILHNPRARVHVDDGRHYLFTHTEPLSLLTIEVNRLWSAGEGDLYSRDFYEICSRRLTDDGVMQQWVPLFSLTLPETLIIIRTVRQVFPYVEFYVGGGSGMIVASRSPLELSMARLKAIDGNPRTAGVLARIELESASSLLGDQVLRPDGVDALLARSTERRISRDLWPVLEYSNARNHVGNKPRNLWHFLLTAEEFKLPDIAGATAQQLSGIQKMAEEERQDQFENLEDH